MLNNISNSIANIINSISNLPNTIITGISGIFGNLIANVGTILDYLNPLGDNFILKKLWVFLTDIISFLNPSSDNFFGKKIIELIGDLLKTLFIPKEDYFSNKFTTLKESFSERLSYQSYIDIFEQSKLIKGDEQLSIDLDNYVVGSNTLSINKFIDLSIFDKYKSTYYGFVRGFTYIFLVLYVINNFYKLILGTSLMNAIIHKNEGE